LPISAGRNDRSSCTARPRACRQAARQQSFFVRISDSLSLSSASYAPARATPAARLRKEQSSHVASKHKPSARAIDPTCNDRSPRLTHPAACRVLPIRHDGQLTGIVSSPANENISLYQNSDLRYMPTQPRAAMRDVSRSSRSVARVAMDACGVRLAPASRAKTPRAYGEIVWSWRRDPGVYPVRLCGPGNGDNKGRSPGRARISRKAIARGRPGCLGCTCQTRVRFFLHCTRRCGRSRRPVFPAPSVQERDNQIAKLRRNRAVRRRAHVRVINGVVARLDRATQYPRGVCD
jgi:hypothetical protein